MTKLMKLKDSFVSVLKNIQHVSNNFYVEECPAYEDIESEFDLLSKEIYSIQAENDKLKTQLTWRPVSEKPEKDGEYLVKFKYSDNTDGMDVCEFEDGDWYWTGIISWFPIPPAPEGEVK